MKLMILAVLVALAVPQAVKAEGKKNCKTKWVQIEVCEIPRKKVKKTTPPVEPEVAKVELKIPEIEAPPPAIPIPVSIQTPEYQGVEANKLELHIGANILGYIMPGAKAAMVGPELRLEFKNFSIGASYAVGGLDLEKQVGEQTRFVNRAAMFVSWKQWMVGPEFVLACNHHVESFHEFGAFVAYDLPIESWLSVRFGGGAGRVWSKIVSVGDGLALHGEGALVFRFR